MNFEEGPSSASLRSKPKRLSLCKGGVPYTLRPRVVSGPFKTPSYRLSPRGVAQHLLQVLPADYRRALLHTLPVSARRGGVGAKVCDWALARLRLAHEGMPGLLCRGEHSRRVAHYFQLNVLQGASSKVGNWDTPKFRERLLLGG